ncbi:hypothetical protein ILUMI_02512 [Ignelater luminosus]|uniref:nicotinamidase n=1 Tax=Ignelater luminosus TaxID=2038154 RepID=A0A8K0DGB7_IGNLU|nr:hypothetical protein ILUMI_02512 [Ignelater luminosus]
MEEFEMLFQSIFRNDKGTIYSLPENKFRDLFRVFDTDDDGFITKEEFSHCWENWIKIVISPTSAFLIVDVQNDFILGSLNVSEQPANQNPEEIIRPINHLLDFVSFDTVFYSLDWHPPNHMSFIDNIHQYEFDPSSPVTVNEAKLYDTVIYSGNPPIRQKLWPKHCIQNGWGAQLHDNLIVLDDAIKIYKGTYPTVESYSAFWDNNKLNQTELYNYLKEKNITDLYICGVAYDVCVYATALDSIEFGYRTIVIDDCCRGMDLNAIEEAKNDILKNNGIIINSHEVKAMVEGRDRKPELGYYLAMQLKVSNNDRQLESHMTKSLINT